MAVPAPARGAETTHGPAPARGAATTYGAATTEVRRIASFLGLGPHVSDRMELADLVAHGLPAASAEAVHEAMGSSTFAAVIPPPTYRRARRSGQPLSRETSEKLYEFARVMELLVRIHKGDEAAAHRFLQRPHAMLGGRPPLEVATSSSAGADAVVELLQRADAGFVA